MAAGDGVRWPRVVGAAGLAGRGLAGLGSAGLGLAGLGPGRRALLPLRANSSSVSAISARSLTRCTPYAAASASHPPSAAASAPEWADTRARPPAERPAVSITTGMPRCRAAASTARSRSGSRMASRTRASTWVSGRPSAYSAYWAAVVTSSWPEDTAIVKPSPRRVRSRAENTEPECVISATGPRGSGSGSTYPTARRP